MAFWPFSSKNDDLPPPAPPEPSPQEKNHRRLLDALWSATHYTDARCSDHPVTLQEEIGRAMADYLRAPVDDRELSRALEEVLSLEGLASPGVLAGRPTFEVRRDDDRPATGRGEGVGAVRCLAQTFGCEHIMSIGIVGETKKKAREIACELARQLGETQKKKDEEAELRHRREMEEEQRRAQEPAFA